MLQDRQRFLLCSFLPFFVGNSTLLLILVYCYFSYFTSRSSFLPKALESQSRMKNAIPTKRSKMFNRPINEILVFPHHKYQLALPEQISSSTYQQCQDQGSKVVFIRPRKEIQLDLQRMSAWYYSERNVKYDLTVNNFMFTLHFAMYGVTRVRSRLFSLTLQIGQDSSKIRKARRFDSQCVRLEK